MDQTSCGSAEEAKALAGKALGWLKQRGAWFWVVVILMVILVFGPERAETPGRKPGDLAGPVAQRPVDQARSGAASPALVKVTARELYRAYRDNEVAAQARYDGKVLEVTGVVKSIELDATNDPLLRFETGQAYDNVTARFEKTAVSDTAAMNKGQIATVRCARVSEVIGNPYLFGCQVVKAS